LNFDEKKIEVKLKSYDWRDLEEAIREIQYGICMLTAYFAGCGEFEKAAVGSIIYLQFTDVARLLRELLYALLTEEDFEDVEERMKKRSHTLDDVVSDPDF